MMTLAAASRFLLLSAFLSGFALSQDTLRLVIVSPRVGETIDRDERDKFRIFSHVDGFKSAVFYQTPERRFFAKVQWQKAGGSETTTIFYYGEQQLMQLSERIDHSEAIQENQYQFGSEPATIEIVGEGVYSGSSLPAARDSTVSSGAAFFRIGEQSVGDRLPLSPAPWPDRISPSYPRLGFGIGFRTGYSPMFTTTEAQNLNRIFTGAGSGFTAEILLEFSRIISLSLDAGNLSGSIAKMNSIAGSIKFRGPNFGTVVPFAAIGIIRVSAHGNDRDQNITFDTGDTGSLFEIGMEISTSFGSSASFYYRRFILDTVTGDYQTLQRGTIPLSLDMNGGVIGVRANLFY